MKYIIDAYHRRVAKKVGGTVVQRFAYNSGSIHPIAEFDSANNLVAKYVYGSKWHVPDYLMRVDGTYRIVTDHLGSVRLVYNVANGSIVQQTAYDEFGNILPGETVASGWSPVPMGFAGGLHDRDTGLVRFGARDYEARSGRWVAKDPIRFGGGAPNLYEYAGNDPVNGIDIDGQQLILLAPFFNPANWSLPALVLAHGFGIDATTVYGAIYGGVQVGPPEVSLHDGMVVFEFKDVPTQTRAEASTTYGNSICYSKEGYTSKQHELAHTNQHRMLGNAYLPLHVFLQSYSYARTGKYHTLNPLEWGPYSKPTPKPWWFR